MAKFVVFVFAMLFSHAAFGQFTANKQTNTISGVASNWVGNGTYVVGSNTFLDTLRLVSSAILSNGSGIIGYEVAASNDVAYIIGTGAVWSNRNNLTIGNKGARSQLIISNGADAFCTTGIVGNAASSSNNTVSVIGTGSTWNNTTVFIGPSGSGNDLVISNGAGVFDTTG